MGSFNRSTCAVCTVVGVFAILFSIIFVISYSFQPIGYFEYGLLKQKSTGFLDRTRVLIQEMLMHGPDFTVQRYTATANQVRLDGLEIATVDRGSIKLSVSFQYFLRKEDIVSLHDEFGEEYDEVVIDRVTDALKAKAPSFSVREYINNRKMIETELFLVSRKRLEGSCCYVACLERRTCLQDCIQRNCSVENRGVFVEVRYFQLLAVSISYSIAERYLQSLILQEQAEMSELKQTSEVIRKETQALREDIRNEAAEIRDSSVIERNSILSEARTNKTATLDMAERKGLQLVYSRLNMQSEEHKNAFDYLRTLRRDPSVHITVDFQQRTVGSWTKN